MPEVLLPIIVAAACLLVGWQRVWIADSLGLMDVPDKVRKFHSRPTPIVGGVMFLLCAVVVLGYGYMLMVQAEEPDQRFFVIAAIVLPHCILGLTDDRYSVPAAARLIYSLSLSAAVLATDRSLSVKDLSFSFGLSLKIGSQVGYFVTLFFVVGLIYAINMMDGLNGVLGTYGLILMVVFARWLYPGHELFFQSIVLCLAIFLAFNLAGLVFAGDGGSYAVGSSAAVMLLHVYDTKTPSAHAFPVDLLMVAAFVPVADSIRVSVARIMAGGSPFAADRNHLHHRLQQRYGALGALAVYSALVAVPIALALAMPSLTWAALLLAIVVYLAVVYGLTQEPPVAART
jgi:UDP-GlcNAc:undecaprenyl-phosphate GlcNAc-1-phosphate transferase